jgi:hypothetical protein
MAKTGKCGTATVEYDDSCSWLCSCNPGQPCQWDVICGTKRVASGTGRVMGDDGAGTSRQPRVTIEGTLDDAVVALEKLWGRGVSVPSEVRGEEVRETVTGTPEEMARALGLKLDPARGEFRV